MLESLEERLENRELELATAGAKIGDYERQMAERTCAVS